tara:strand:+ start:7427 stop:7669 length:243 start_codon:yes stop_codon:yes gene_type:complete
MPRKTGTPNRSLYHYSVEKNGIKELFNTTKQITEKYGLNRSAIYFKVIKDTSRISKKFSDYSIDKIIPPLPCFRQEKILY